MTLLLPLLLSACVRPSRSDLRPPAPLRIACLGDSITFGSGIQDRKHASWPAILGSLLGKPHVVRNFGVSGSTLLRKGNRPIWKEKAFAEALRFAPDQLFVLLGTNDSKQRNWRYKAEFEGDLRELIHRFRTKRPDMRITLCLPPPAWTHGPGIDGKRIETEVTPRLRSVAKALSLPTLDLHAALREQKRLFPDGVHPNPFGAERIARLAYRSLFPDGTPISFACIPQASLEFRGRSAGWGGGNWRVEFARVRKLAREHKELDLIFLGDSITQGLTGAQNRLAMKAGKRAFDRSFASYRAASFGLSGDRTEHLLYRIDHGQFEGLSPRCIVLTIGVNNLGLKQYDGEETADGIRAVVKRLRERIPNARVLLLGCFPSKDDPQCWRRKQIDILHARIAPLGALEGVDYIDLRRLFLRPDGRLNKALFRKDLVHLSQQGMQRWVTAMEPFVHDAMGTTIEQEKQPAWLLRAGRVRPSERQVAWQRRELTGFLHFGVNTFTDREWGTGKEDPALFRPTGLDTDQWARVAKAAGMKMLILTAKHHDGFCLWQTRYTTHSVASSPWMQGKGDVVRALARSCKQQGLDLGIYLSPADLYQIENAKGLYGNGSKYRERVIPRPVPGRPFLDKRSFRYVVDDYNEYYMNQLFELLTEYGPVKEVWLDGAHPKRKGGQTYTYAAWYELIRKLAPEAMIFGKGPDCRWIGNEHGGAREAEWSVVPLPVPAKDFDWGDMTKRDLGSRQRIQDAKFLHWYPAEMDTSIRPGWFYHAKQDGHARSSLERLSELYFRGTGGNAVLLLNVPPDRRGKIHEVDEARLRAFGAWQRMTFSRELARGARAVASSSRPKHGPSHALDGNLDSYWQAEEGVNRTTLECRLSKPQNFSVLSLREAIQIGQRIERFQVEARSRNGWAVLGQGHTIGARKLLRFPKVEADRVRVRIQSSRGSPTLSELAIY